MAVAAKKATKDAPGGGLNLLGGGEANKLFGSTSLEKMGFVFGGGGPSIITDHLSEVAKNTRELVNIAKHHPTTITQPVTNAPR
jgi:hypothetical protein